MALVTIIIPTFNNREYLDPCIRSILMHQTTPGLYKIIIVNNGDKESVVNWTNPEIEVIHAGKNLGWEGGLKEGLKHVKTPYVVFMNDDTYIPFSSAVWLYQMLMAFSNPKVAAVGPTSNVVMGLQNIFVPTFPNMLYLKTNILIGFCVMVRMEALEKVGGIDDSMPNHGDDLDLSIRFREAGYDLICDKSVFVYHHGFKTGQREYGSEWNSVNMTEKTNNWLIRKHGLKTFMKYLFQPLAEGEPIGAIDSEGDICRKYVKGSVLEIGCGNTKTVPDSVGTDIVPKGEPIPCYPGKLSVADIVADVSKPLPLEDNSVDTIIARHLLEHMIDPITVLKNWRRVLKNGGRIIIAVPDESKRQTIPMNYEHVHAYTQDSLKNLMETLGWHTEHLEDAHNGMSLVGIFNKNGVSNGL